MNEKGTADFQTENAFKYHPPTPEQAEKYELLRTKATELVYLVNELCPQSRERSLAVTNIEQAVMWANASVARHE